MSAVADSLFLGYNRYMGFFSELGKALVGKPLGPQPKQSQDQQAPVSTPQASSSVLDERGRKIIPDIDLKNLRSHRQGDEKLLVKAWIVNNSDQVLRIDTSYLLKQKRTHNQFINPHDSHEATLYDGKIPDTENEHDAQIAYRLQVNGDVFMENYRVDYGRESDGKYIVEELIADGPVRDI